MSHSPHLPVIPATAPAGPALDQSLLDSDLTPEEVVVVAHGPEKASVLNQDALDRWDSDGGTIPEPSRDPGEPRDAPSLPARAIERERGIEGTTPISRSGPSSAEIGPDGNDRRKTEIEP